MCVCEFLSVCVTAPSPTLKRLKKFPQAVRDFPASLSLSLCVCAHACVCARARKCEFLSVCVTALSTTQVTEGISSSCQRFPPHSLSSVFSIHIHTYNPLFSLIVSLSQSNTHKNTHIQIILSLSHKQTYNYSFSLFP